MHIARRLGKIKTENDPLGVRRTAQLVEAFVSRSDKLGLSLGSHKVAGENT